MRKNDTSKVYNIDFLKSVMKTMILENSQIIDKKHSIKRKINSHMEDKASEDKKERK